MIEFPCPNCEMALELDDTLAGSLGRCPHCKKPIQVPSESVAPITVPHISGAVEALPDLERIEIDPDKPRPKPIYVPAGGSSDESVVDYDRVRLRDQWIGLLIGFFVGFGLAAAAATVVSAMREGKAAQAAPLPHNGALAYLVSQRYVLERTTLTDVVHFPWRGYESKYIGSGQYIVRGEYIVRELQGDTRYMEYSCMVSYLSNGNWQCTDLITSPRGTRDAESK